MQMHAITPLLPVIPETKETIAGDGVSFIDSLRAVHSKSAFTRNWKPESKTRQDGAYPPATQSGPANIPGPEQMLIAEPGGQATAAARPQDNSSPSWNGFITIRLGNWTDPNPATSAEGLPGLARTPFQQITELIQLKVQNDLPPASSQPMERPDLPTPLIAGHLSGRAQKVPLTDFLFVALKQTAADPTFSRYTEILGHPVYLTAETVPALVLPGQQHPLPGGRFASKTVADHNPQKPGVDLTVLNIFEQVLAEKRRDSSGNDIMWGLLASIDPSAPHPKGADSAADLINTFNPALNTPTNHIMSQNGSAARSHQGIAVPGHLLVDNVIQKISLRISQGQNRSISIRLHPEELGHLKMDLRASDRNITAHIHVQTQLTQEILTKHLHRLRDGLAQQGLVLDEIQVSVDSDTSNAPDFFNDQRTLHARLHHRNAIRPGEAREAIIVGTVAAPSVADGSINLRI